MLRALALAGIGCLTLAAPAQAADGVSYGLYQAGAGKGIVVLEPSGLSFQFFGLRPSTRYRVVVSSKGCASTKGVITQKTFRTNPRGVVWDPAPVRSNAVPRSAKLVRAGKTVGCAPLAQSDDEETGLKIAGRSPAVVVISQSPTTWRTSMTVTGLTPNGAYQVVGLGGPCARTSTPVTKQTFTANAKGAALVDASVAAVAGQSIVSVAVLDASGQQVIFCKAL